MWILFIVLAGMLAGVIGDYLKHRRKMEKMKLDHIDKEIELERGHDTLVKWTIMKRT